MGKDLICFLGTGGARFVVFRQLRSSAGLWCRFNGLNLCIDPGPGTLVRCFAGEETFCPEELDAVILSHRHLDHSADANVMVEAMTRGTFQRRGVLLAPGDALNGQEPVVFRYLRQAVERVEVLKEGGVYRFQGITLTTPVRHLHGVETYGLQFTLPYGRVAFVTDSSYFPRLAEHYARADLLILNVVLLKHPGHPKIKHLDLEGAERIIAAVRPRKAYITHFGTTMLDNDPPALADRLTCRTGVEVEAAKDGLVVELEKLLKR
jgi:phosphoribosyl 1,2-cyclic phosphodiesterase